VDDGEGVLDLGRRGKVAAVSGANAGIGRAIAESLAAEGMRLAICARHPQPLERAAAALREAHGVEVWATSAADVQPRADGAAAHIGALHDLFVNPGSPSGGVRDTSDAHPREAFELRILADAHLIRAAAGTLQARGGGAIANNASFTVHEPRRVSTLSGATPPGLIGLVKTLAKEQAPLGIRVNSIASGFVLTPARAAHQEIQAREARLSTAEYVARGSAAVRLQRPARPQEIGDVVAILLSDRATYITGATIAIDGGPVRPLLQGRPHCRLCPSQAATRSASAPRCR